MSVSPPVFTFGIIGDPQYVDQEDKISEFGSATRHYRRSLQVLEKAAAFFVNIGTSCNIILGDLVDMSCGAGDNADWALGEVLHATKCRQSTWHYCIGNHDICVLSRVKLYDLLIPEELKSICSSNMMYYSFPPDPGYRFIVLDSFDLSEISPSITTEKSIARQIIDENNPNIRVRPNKDWFEGLDGNRKRFNPAGGGVSQRQLNWLENTLYESKRNMEIVFIFTHIPMARGGAEDSCLLWNYEEVLEIIHQSGNVAAVICGQDHAGGYIKDSTGVHHITLPSPLNCTENEELFGYISVYENIFQLHWTGKTPIRNVNPSWPESMSISCRKNDVDVNDISKL